jgi:hypothetical protein
MRDWSGASRPASISRQACAALMATSASWPLIRSDSALRSHFSAAADQMCCVWS